VFLFAASAVGGHLAQEQIIREGQIWNSVRISKVPSRKAKANSFQNGRAET
jgi:hypothetical protein